MERKVFGVADASGCLIKAVTEIHKNYIRKHDGL